MEGSRGVGLGCGDRLKKLANKNWPWGTEVLYSLKPFFWGNRGIAKAW